MNTTGGGAGRAGDSRDVLTRPARPPDLVLRYGDRPDQVADVHLPAFVAGSAPVAGQAGAAAPAVVLFLHGGFWRAAYGREHTAPLAEALSAAGFVVCAPEYRRTGQPGGGWPGTLDDVAAAADRLPGLLEQATAGLVSRDRMLLAGHSAGGHLALWAASRHRLPAAAPWHAGSPAGHGRQQLQAPAPAGSRGPWLGVVALAAVSDLRMCYEQALGGQAVGDLLGGGPARFPDRYALADPAQLLPIGLPVQLVHGDSDDIVPCAMSEAYAERARQAGDPVRQVLLRGAGHFDVIDPASQAWPAVADAFCQVARR
jgi:acetyl esterase/lipase